MGLTKPRAAQIFNLDYKQSTRVVTTTNITLTGGAPNSVDGVTLSLNDRVLVTGQSTGSQNGLYLVTTLGSGSNGTWARTSDGNETGEIEAGMIVMVTEGAIYADTQWKLITDDPITIGVTALTFVQNYSANSISSGSSNVVVNSNANVTISSAGTANVLLISSTGTVTSGTASVTGNITGGNVVTSGVISTTGNAIVGNILTNGYYYANGAVFGGGGGGGTPGGADTQIQFNDNGVFGGSAGLTFNKTTNAVATTGTFSATGNVTGGNILTGGLISATGSIIGAVISIPAGALTLTNQGSVNDVIAGTKNVGQVIIGGTTQTGAIVVGQSTATQSLLLASGVTSSGNTKTISIGQSGASGSNTNITLGPSVGVGTVNIGSGTTMVIANTSGTALSVAGTVTAGSVVGGIITGTSTSVTGTTTAVSTVGGVITGTSVSVTGAVTGASTVGGVITGTSVSVTGAVTGASTVGGVITGSSVSVTGAVTGASLTGTITTAAQTNITSVGTLGSLSVTANVQGGNLRTAGLISATGSVTAASVVGGVITGTSTSVTGAQTAASTVGGVITGSSVSVTGAQTAASTVGGVITGTSASVSGTVTAASTVGGVITGSSASVTGAVTGASTVGGVITGSSLSVSGNVQGGNLRTAGLISATGAVTGAAITGTSLTVSTGNITGGNLILSGAIEDSAQLDIRTTASNGNIVLTPNGTGVIVAAKDIRNGQANGVGNIGTVGGFFNTIFAKSTSAQYADLAEKYTADSNYPPGTVIEFGGPNEVTITTASHSTQVAGIVSTNPSYLMNSGLVDAIDVALVGRVPCHVIGTIAKGDRLVASSTPGVATRLDMSQYQPGCIIGKALESYDSDTVGTIEVAVGRI
jgi:hypothetical protein